MRLLVFVLLFSTGALAQTKDSIPVFKNEGEREAYYVKQTFKKEYKKQQHNRFDGLVKSVNNSAFTYRAITIVVNYTADDLRLIFGQSILHPGFFGGEDSLRVTDLHELKYVDNGPTCKRFSLWLFRKMFANPQVYYLELTNEKATSATSLKEFIKGAQLTFFRAGGIIL